MIIQKSDTLSHICVDKWSSHPEMIEIIDLQKKGLVGKVGALTLSSCSSLSSEDGKEEDEITLFKDKTNPFSVLF